MSTIENTIIDAALSALAKGRGRLVEKAKAQADPADRCVTRRTVQMLESIASDLKEMKGLDHE